MGVFLFSTYELDSTAKPDRDKIFRKVLDYIIYNLNDVNWQESLSKTVKENVKSERVVKIYIRFFSKKKISGNKLRSYAKFDSKESSLIIDPIFALDDYVMFSEGELRKNICNDLFCYLKEMIIKYKDRFKGFDGLLFIPLLDRRFEELKSEKLPYQGSDELENLLEGLLD